MHSHAIVCSLLLNPSPGHVFHSDMQGQNGERGNHFLSVTFFMMGLCYQLHKTQSPQTPTLDIKIKRQNSQKLILQY